MEYVIHTWNPKFKDMTFDGYIRNNKEVWCFKSARDAFPQLTTLIECWPDGRWELIPRPHSVKDSPQYILKRCPRLVAHVIADSLGYATPMTAAWIIADAHARRENNCEWIDACYGRKPRPAVERAIQNRKRHTGYMASYQQARGIITRALEGNHPVLASWF